MPAANLPTNEQERLQNLYSYELLDTLPEKDYDDITKLASFICNTPVSLITLVDKDRQWMKSAHGITLEETLREHAFCAHAILQPDEMMVVSDAEKDERFSDNPLVTGEPHILFYAGVPLVTEEGFAIGSLCVLDNKPGHLNENQREALKTLANQTIRLVQLHRKAKELLRSRQLLQEVNTELENFAQNAAENLKQPCDNAIEFTNIISEKFSDVLDADGKQILSLIIYSCESIKATIDDTLQKAARLNFLQETKSLFTFTSIMQDLKQTLPSSTSNISIGNHPENDSIFFFKNLLLQALTHIIIASTTFNNKANQLIDISFQPTKQAYLFTIVDNGNGIPVVSRSGELKLLQHQHLDDKDNQYIKYLTAAKQIVTSLAGTLDMNFDENKSTVFIMKFPK